jgi:hypothetical protein
MSTPIFDQLNSERGYERMVRWTPPVFQWFRPVVQLDKQPVTKPALEVQTLSGAPYGGPTQG